MLESTRLALVSGGLAVSVLATAISASAAPITTYYQVTVNERYSPSNPAADFVTIDPISFLMSMTFDDQIVFAAVHSRSYGQPTFSGIPDSLVMPASAASVPTRSAGTNVNENASGIGGSAARYDVLRTETSDGLETLIHSVSLSSLARVAGRLDHSFFSDAIGREFGFETRGFEIFDDIGPTGEIYSPDSFVYLGTATQVAAPTPVPEPTTLALFGTGVALSALRVRRTRRNPKGESTASTTR